MESALYSIYTLVFVSEILLVRCAHSFDFWYFNNSCVNTVRQHFPWSILYFLTVYLKLGTLLNLFSYSWTVRETIIFVTPKTRQLKWRSNYDFIARGFCGEI